MRQLGEHLDVQTVPLSSRLDLQAVPLSSRANRVRTEPANRVECLSTHNKQSAL